MELEHSDFPSAQILADFRAGRLDAQTRKDVLKHLTGCAECRDDLLAAAEMETEPAQVVRGINWSRAATAAVAAAAAVAIVFLTPSVRERIWPPDEMKQLAAAVSQPERRSLGRITAFPYQEYRVTRGAGDDSKDNKDDYTLLQAGANVHTLHARGVVALVTRRTADDLTDARRLLEQAATKTPNDPTVLSDLAVAYLAAGKNDEALATAERAWKLAQTPETAWNRAAAAQSAHSPQAITYWKDYLKLDSTSPWAKEASDHLDRLEHPL
jgi:tetratricopeptide (TPR) repeat protein